MAAHHHKYERVETSDSKAFYQTTPSLTSQQQPSLTANQLSHLAEYDELNTFRDGVFECTENVYPSCICSFCCPYVHLGQLASKLQLCPCWVIPALLFVVFFIMLRFDSPWTEAAYFGVWASAIFIVRHQVRKFFRPNPGLLGDFSSLPGHLDDFCLGLWCGCCAIAQLSRHLGNYKLHGSSCARPNVEDHDDLV
ncbi:hypothetical protein CTAYLR_006176 [Chrysophaeum taylorii]|uniref:Uncharacterized protein n=1 Tax=Chrysophaeum taylorii TaxID=2483200 RepID=A0AAD7UN65_9STRA|nr:hypothetical protein CTAYLR_006176 [Chrysophaeum taylorii]